MQRFDKFNAEQNGAAPESEPTEPVPTVEVPTANGTKGTAADTPNGISKRSPDESALSELDESPPKKKQKKQRSIEDDDAAFAAKLQAEENRRARSTRGANTKKRATVPKKKTQKKKSANRVKDEDDSDIGSGSTAEKKSPSRKGGFHVGDLDSIPLVKELTAIAEANGSFACPLGALGRDSGKFTHPHCASLRPVHTFPSLSMLTGILQLSRPQTVKKIWEYVKERDLQDPNDKRQIRCDEAMRAVFKTDRVHMFTMNKILNQNLYAVDEE